MSTWYQAPTKWERFAATTDDGWWASWRRGRKLGWVEVCVTWDRKVYDRPDVDEVARELNAKTPAVCLTEGCLAASRSLRPEDISGEAPNGFDSLIFQIAVA